ncbi:MAG: hypothetical protein CK547_01615 [Chitinophagaceae bacterium]|nr:MAG: hypothetical protein CK547_01615 [Chitinophagaceae bacterium]
MFEKRFFLIVCFLLLVFLGSKLFGQTTLPVSNSSLEEIFRRKQLMSDTGKGDLSNFSFMVRPIELEKFTGSNRKLFINLLPVEHLEQFNPKVPLRYADGSMYPTRGWQGLYAIGAETRYQNFMLRLRPEYVWAFNQSFPTFPSDHYNIIWNYYYTWLNKIDQPERFNQEPIRKLFLGQSRLQYEYKNMAVGISTENLWWGPGRFNSLIMSNNAPGFLHYTFNSTKPIRTPVGSFEWQLVWGGKLKNSGILPDETNRTFNGRFVYRPKDSVHQRIFTGGIISWQPKWLKGLFIGTDLASIQYKKSGIPSATMGSVFARYILPEENAEMYIQYGRSDKMATAWNLLEDTIPRGYLAGARKLFRISSRTKKNPSFLQLGIEVTQLQVPNLSLILQAKSWYTDNSVRHGFTHNGQVLGAAIGPGSNSQRLEFSWVKGTTKVGIEVERLVHNADFYYNYNMNSGSKDFNRQWVDLSSSFVWSFSFKQWLFFGQVSFIRSINYNWKSLIPQPVTPENYFSDGWDLMNVHRRIGFVYDWSKVLERVKKNKRNNLK